jgi:hypothetical protein
LKIVAANSAKSLTMKSHSSTVCGSTDIAAALDAAIMPAAESSSIRHRRTSTCNTAAVTHAPAAIVPVLSEADDNAFYEIVQAQREILAQLNSDAWLNRHVPHKSARSERGTS